MLTERDSSMLGNASVAIKKDKTPLDMLRDAVNQLRRASEVHGNVVAQLVGPIGSNGEVDASTHPQPPATVFSVVEDLSREIVELALNITRGTEAVARRLN